MGLRTGRIAIERRHWITLGIGTAATVLGGVILQLLGYLDDVAAWFWDAAISPVTLPAILILLLVAALVRLAWPHARRQISARRGSRGVGKLNDLQIRMLAVYRLLSQHWMRLSFFESAFNDHHSFRVQQALDGLVDLGYLDVKNSPDSEYHLTRSGRDTSLDIDMAAQGLVAPAQPEDDEDEDNS